MELKAEGSRAADEYLGAFHAADRGCATKTGVSRDGERHHRRAESGLCADRQPTPPEWRASANGSNGFGAW